LSGTNNFSQSYIVRRKKEFLPLLVVRFLRAYDTFNGIYGDFQEHSLVTVGYQAQAEGSCFKRINHLEQSLFFDIEAKSRFLFRRFRGTNLNDTEIQSKHDDLIAYLSFERSPVNDGEIGNTFSQLRKSLLNKSLDTNIRKILYILRLLKVNLHELEYYDVEYAQEHEYVVKIESLFNKFGRVLEKHERHELAHIKDIDKISHKIINDTKNHIKIAMQRCRSLFHETSQILLHVIQEARKNEVLVLNLIRERELIDRIYGSKAHERIFSGMYASMPNLGHTGLEKAINYCRYNCNNTSGLPEVTDHLPADNPEHSQSRKDNRFLKETTDCYFQ
jgi:hypothetical protein